MTNLLFRLGRLVTDALLPPLCLSCHAPVGEPGALCPACWSKTEFLAPPYCACCGLPFEVEVGPEAVCGDCARDPPRFRRARAVFRYDDESRALILRFKHGDRLEGVPAFARWMARAGADVLAGADLLVPVPLHRWRLLSRRYNQAALLAMGVARQTGIAAIPDLLTRLRPTPSQGHMGREGRARNVAGAFTVASRRLGALGGKRVVLIDDVMTSGATIGECARVLLRAGALSVDVLTLARVVKVG
ncbi:Phosphoribosyltransferase [Candidatus Terasakiella magnetica]|nr:Phosphoribosyltransferase [Candidatus Terasakiella magnetica]